MILYRNEIVLTGFEVPFALDLLGYSDENNEELNFSALIQYPEEFAELDDRAARFSYLYNRISDYEREATRARKLYALWEDFGVPSGTIRLATGLEQGGNEWCRENWGSSGAENVWVRHVNGIVGYHANLSFVTQGGAPVFIVTELSRRFPDVGIWLIYKEAFSKWEMSIHFAEGREIFRIRSKGAFPLVISR